MPSVIGASASSMVSAMTGITCSLRPICRVGKGAQRRAHAEAGRWHRV
jgi:hypothetical protein